MKYFLFLIIFIITGCATTEGPAKFTHTAELGVRAYHYGNPELAVVLLRPGVMSYLGQDSSDFLAESNLSEKEFNKSIDYLLVSSWESNNTELFEWLYQKKLPRLVF